MNTLPISATGSSQTYVQPRTADGGKAPGIRNGQVPVARVAPQPRLSPGSSSSGSMESLRSIESIEALPPLGDDALGFDCEPMNAYQHALEYNDSRPHRGEPRGDGEVRQGPQFERFKVLVNDTLSPLMNRMTSDIARTCAVLQRQGRSTPTASDLYSGGRAARAENLREECTRDQLRALGVDTDTIDKVIESRNRLGGVAIIDACRVLMLEPVRNGGFESKATALRDAVKAYVKRAASIRGGDFSGIHASWGRDAHRTLKALNGALDKLIKAVGEPQLKAHLLQDVAPAMAHALERNGHAVTPESIAGALGSAAFGAWLYMGKSDFPTFLHMVDKLPELVRYNEPRQSDRAPRAPRAPREQAPPATEPGPTSAPAAAAPPVQPAVVNFNPIFNPTNNPTISPVFFNGVVGGSGRSHGASAEPTASGERERSVLGFPPRLRFDASRVDHDARRADDPQGPLSTDLDLTRIDIGQAAPSSSTPVQAAGRLTTVLGPTAADLPRELQQLAGRAAAPPTAAGEPHAVDTHHPLLSAPAADKDRSAAPSAPDLAGARGAFPHPLRTSSAAVPAYMDDPLAAGVEDPAVSERPSSQPGTVSRTRVDTPAARAPAPTHRSYLGDTNAGLRRPIAQGGGSLFTLDTWSWRDNMHIKENQPSSPSRIHAMTSSLTRFPNGELRPELAARQNLRQVRVDPYVEPSRAQINHRGAGAESEPEKVRVIPDHADAIAP